MKLITAKLRYTSEATPDFSYLGYFTNEPPSETLRKAGRVFEHEPNNPHTLNYFVSVAPLTESGAASDFCRENYERMLEYEEGFWHPMFVRLEVVVEIGGSRQTIVSPGQDGVASDCDCLGDVAEEELDALEPVLRELGFSIKDVLELGLEI